MDFLLSDISAATLINTPKLSSQKFELRNNYYIVTNGSSFNYYAIKMVEFKEGAEILRFEKSPPVILEGVAVIDKRAFRVTVQDLLRRVVRKSREIDLGTLLDGNSSRRIITETTNDSTDPIIGISATNTVRHTDQLSTSTEDPLAFSEAADAAWSEQIGALFRSISQEEGFEGQDWETSEAP